MVSMFLYSALTVLFAPFIYVWLFVRKIKGKEDKTRFFERLGNPRKKRPDGKLIWMHGASVGECLSMLPLIKEILSKDKKAHILVTSGTVTSAGVLAKKLPPRAFHQYIPVDFPWSAKRFVAHWHPDSILWFESDFWPHVLAAVHKTGAPLVLLNGRISDRSFKRWQKNKGFIKSILSLFTLCFGQTQEDANRLKILGAPEVSYEGNLKFAAPALECDARELEKLRSQMGRRPRLLAASTHPGEDEMILRLVQYVKQSHPTFLTVIAPRHPHRGDEIERLFKKASLTVSRRSRGDEITPQTDLYLADTIGEMGLIYHLADLVFVGGSLVPFGGQNMLEPMRLGRAVFVGPYTFNFKQIVQQASQSGALIQVAEPSELLGNVSRYLTHPDGVEAIKEKARAFAESQSDVLDSVYRTLKERIHL